MILPWILVGIAIIAAAATIAWLVDNDIYQENNMTNEKSIITTEETWEGQI